MQARIVLLHALTPLHAGIGQGVGAIDLPIARDVATNRPLVPGSSVKGVLRDAHLSLGDEQLTYKIFGPPTESSSEYAGALQISRSSKYTKRSSSDSPTTIAGQSRSSGWFGLGLDLKK